MRVRINTGKSIPVRLNKKEDGVNSTLCSKKNRRLTFSHQKIFVPLKFRVLGMCSPGWPCFQRNAIGGAIIPGLSIPLHAKRRLRLGIVAILFCLWCQFRHSSDCLRIQPICSHRTVCLFSVRVYAILMDQLCASVFSSVYCGRARISPYIVFVLDVVCQKCVVDQLRVCMQHTCTQHLCVRLSSDWVENDCDCALFWLENRAGTNRIAIRFESGCA